MKRETEDTQTTSAGGTRVEAFARIERQNAAATTDPKVMALTRARDDDRAGDFTRAARLLAREG